MIGIPARIRVLAMVALLLSGVAQPIASAQGLTCPRAHDVAQAQGETAGSPLSVASSDRLPAHSFGEHDHPHDSGEPQAAGGCGVVGIPVERGSGQDERWAVQLLPRGDLPPANGHTRTPFRPPRLS